MAGRSTKPTKPKVESRRIARWLAERDVEALAAFLTSGTHHGRPGVPAAVKLQVIAAIRELTTPKQRLAWAGRLAARSENIARQIACGLLAEGFASDRERTVRRMRALAEDPDWEVREWAAELFAGVLALDFREALALYRRFAKEGSEELRRAVALALGFRTKARVAAEVEPMLGVLALLMTKPGAYLQKNLGPFVLGGAFLSRHPEETLAFCRRFAARRDENGRVNTALAFSAAPARRHATAAAGVLDVLSADPRPRVVRAVARARRNLARVS